MEIVRTAKFNKICKSEIIKETDIDNLMTELAEDPEEGSIMQGTGGLRKIQMSIGNKGKSGGARDIYYYQIEKVIILITLYKKSVKENITNEEKKKMKKIAEQIKNSLK
jgi:hypothetical protein